MFYSSIMYFMNVFYYYLYCIGCVIYLFHQTGFHECVSEWITDSNHEFHE